MTIEEQLKMLNNEFHRLKFQTFEEAKNIIDKYIYFYNNERIQLKIKLTPL